MVKPTISSKRNGSAGEDMKERFHIGFYFMVVLSFCGVLYYFSSIALSLIFGSLDADTPLISYIQGFIISFFPAFFIVLFTKHLNTLRLISIFGLLILVQMIIPIGIALGLEDVQLDGHLFYTLAEVFPYYIYGIKFIFVSILLNIMAMLAALLMKKMG
jgi:uncharacterized membrane protein